MTLITSAQLDVEAVISESVSTANFTIQLSQVAICTTQTLFTMGSMRKAGGALPMTTGAQGIGIFTLEVGLMLPVAIHTIQLSQAVFANLPLEKGFLVARTAHFR
jgi:hypothetical protein